MERRRASWIGCALAAALAVVGSVIVIGSADIATAAVSDDDCEVLLNARLHRLGELGERQPREPG